MTTERDRVVKVTWYIIHITHQLHYIIHIMYQLHYISTCRRPLDSKLGNERLQFLKPHEPLITWPIRPFFFFLISSVTRLMTSKPGRILTYERRFSMQTLKLLLTSCLFLLVTVFSNCCLKCVWPGSELLIWYAVSFQPMYFRDK